MVSTDVALTRGFEGLTVWSKWCGELWRDASVSMRPPPEQRRGHDGNSRSRDCYSRCKGCTLMLITSSERYLSRPVPFKRWMAQNEKSPKVLTEQTGQWSRGDGRPGISLLPVTDQAKLELRWERKEDRLREGAHSLGTARETERETEALWAEILLEWRMLQAAVQLTMDSHVTMEVKASDATKKFFHKSL